MTGRRFEFPSGALYEVIVTAESTAGRRSEMQVTLPPLSLASPPHIHPRQQETCTVGEGTLEVLLGRRWRMVAAGEEIAIPPGTAHALRNGSMQNVVFRTVHEPALETERYLERMYWLSAMNRITNGRDLTSALYRSLVADTHRAEQLPARLGTRLKVRTLAGVARALGLKIDRTPIRR